MAAPKVLDPSQTTTASSAFAYPLPQVRQFHRTLTSELDEKNARLRTLVGGSYRQLLGTAEMILEMKKDIGVVEEKLGSVGEGCGRNMVGAKVNGLGTLLGAAEKQDMEWVARRKALGMCALVVGRLLKRGGNLVLTAKVLVLSRLLGKSVSDLAVGRSEAEKDSLNEIRRKIATLRARLSAAIVRKLGKCTGKDGDEDILQALAAYSLAASSGAKDVLRHFLDVRREAIALAFEDHEEQIGGQPGILKALKLYAGTLLDVQALVPRRLSESLASLKTQALLRDDAIRDLEGLRLDICEKWFGDEILHFTPYIRHNDLDGPHAVETLKAWAKGASELLLQGLGQTLDRTLDFRSVIELRMQILEIWIKEGGKARGFDPSILLNGLRKILNDRMVVLLESRIAKLHLVGTEIEATLGSWRPGITNKHESLWDDTMLELEITNGAELFKQNILARTYGRNDAVSRVFSGYQTWRHLVGEIITFITQLQKHRWDDDLEDIEDDLSLESRSTLLSQEDPQVLQDHLDSSLERYYKELHDKIGALLTIYEDNAQIGQISIFILRVIRDIRTELPEQPSVRSFGLSLVPALHEKLALTVSSEPLEAFSRNFKGKRVPGRALWEGNPELPVQPTPRTFKFLRDLSLAMAKAGSDLWSPNAVNILKHYLRTELSKSWRSQLKTIEETKTTQRVVNGQADVGENEDGKEHENEEGKEEASEEAESLRQELLIQSLFDLLVLWNALSSSSLKQEEDGLGILGQEIESSGLDLVAGSKKRLQHGAKEYWVRTSLLFGLLA